ncbi:MAG: hypothetical protein IKC19_07855 [Bacteroidales bacterium]|nr:hypothetical protein [Bacteroidales bacterium]
MAKKRYALVVMAAALVFGSLAMVSCGEEEPEEIHYSEYDDSTGLAITDSITVIFNGVQWKTKTFTANIVKQENSVYKWAYINAHKPGSRFPAIYLKMYLGKGNHTTYMTFNDPGLGYITPGALTGDPQGGALFYYENAELSAPDGTKTSDWWPLEVTTSVLDYNDTTGTLTARVIATMFDYRSWVEHEVQSADSCETASLSVTFGGLSIK